MKSGASLLGLAKSIYFSLSLGLTSLCWLQACFGTKATGGSPQQRWLRDETTRPQHEEENRPLPRSYQQSLYSLGFAQEISRQQSSIDGSSRCQGILSELHADIVSSWSD